MFPRPEAYRRGFTVCVSGCLKVLCKLSSFKYNWGMSENKESLGELLHRKITDRLPPNPSKADITAYVDAAIADAIRAGYGKANK